MKKILIASFLFLSVGLSAQFLEVQGKGLVKSTWIFNQNISDQGDIQDYRNSLGYSYGLGVNVYPIKWLGFGVDGLFGKHTGGFRGTDSGSTYKSDITLSTIDLPLMVKLRAPASGAFIEIGPQYSMIRKVEYVSEGDITDKKDVTTQYQDHNLSMLLGFGLRIKLGDSGKWGLATGLRLEYGLSDLKGVDALGNLLSYYKEEQETWTAAGGVQLGLTYMIGGAEGSEQ